MNLTELKQEIRLVMENWIPKFEDEFTKIGEQEYDIETELEKKTKLLEDFHKKLLDIGIFCEIINNDLLDTNIVYTIHVKWLKSKRVFNDVNLLILKLFREYYRIISGNVYSIDEIKLEPNTKKIYFLIVQKKSCD